MKLGNRDYSAWHMFGFALTAITIVAAVGLVIESSELAMDGWVIIGWQFICIIPLLGGMVAYAARRVWLAGRLTRHFMEPEGRILLPSLAVIVIGALLAYSGWVHDARFALSRGAFERAVRSGEIFEPYSGERWIGPYKVRSIQERWIGLYKVRSIQIDAQGRTAFDLGDCSMFAHCELEFDATTPCELRGWREYSAVDTHWCVVVHDHL